MFRLTLRQGSCRSLCFGGARRTVARGGGYCSCSCTARRFMCLALKSVARFLSFTTLCAGVPCTPCVRHAREPHGAVDPSVPASGCRRHILRARTCGACAPVLRFGACAPCRISPFARRAACGAAGGAGLLLSGGRKLAILYRKEVQRIRNGRNILARPRIDRIRNGAAGCVIAVSRSPRNAEEQVQRSTRRNFEPVPLRYVDFGRFNVPPAGTFTPAPAPVPSVKGSVPDSASRSAAL